MGKYINVKSTGQELGSSYGEKIEGLIADGATKVSGEEYQDNLVCVVDNGAFAAAAYMYSEAEYVYFTSPEMIKGRPQTWLVHPKAAEMVD